MAKSGPFGAPFLATKSPGPFFASPPQEMRHIKFSWGPGSAVVGGVRKGHVTKQNEVLFLSLSRTSQRYTNPGWEEGVGIEEDQAVPWRDLALSVGGGIAGQVVYAMLACFVARFQDF